MQPRTLYVAVDADGAACGHLHVEFADALRCGDRSGVAPRGDEPPARVLPGAGIDRTAIVAASARIAPGARVGAYAIVEDDVVVGSGSDLKAHCILRRGSTIGEGCVIDSFAVIGGDPQDLRFDPATPSAVVVGNRVTVREAVTVHRSTVPGGATRIADGAMLMANCHVAHDCVVGRDAVLANNVMLAGHVVIGAGVFIGGGVGIHQYVRIGEGAMIGGHASIAYDVAPFTMATGRSVIHGLNVVGLRRRKVPVAEINDLKQCYRAVFGVAGDARRNAAAALTGGRCGDSAVGRKLLEFFADGVRGFARPRSRE